MIRGMLTFSAVWEEQSEYSLLMLVQVLKAPDELTFSFRVMMKVDS